MKRKQARSMKALNGLIRHYDFLRSMVDGKIGTPAPTSRPGHTDPAIRHAPRAKSLSDMDGNERDGDS